jgi:U4/U6 small nuclear ribonucleoprotein PRP4
MEDIKTPIFFGSIEGLADDTPSATAAIQAAKPEFLPFSDGTSEEISKKNRLLNELEEKKKARELSIPTNDDLVKARLQELNEPIIMFGEQKPERRERLRKIMAERGITEGMPTTIKRSVTVQAEPQNETVATIGPKELRLARIKITETSLANSKSRLLNRKKVTDHMENHWGDHEKAFSQMFDKMSKMSEVSSTIGDHRPISSVSFNKDGSLIATTSWSGQCKIWEVGTSKIKAEWNAHTERANCVKFFPRAEGANTVNLATGGADDKVHLWSLNNDKPIHTLSGHLGRVNNVEYHPQYNYIASTSFDKTWCLWDMETGKELLCQGGNSRAVYGIAFHGDGALVCTSGLDAVARLWDLRSGKAIWNLRGHAKQILSVDFSGNGYQLATASDDHTVRVWDIRKRKTAQIILAHNSLISTVKYQPQHGNYFVTAGYDNLIKVWSAKDFSLVKTLSGHSDKISCVDISPNTYPHIRVLSKYEQMKSEIKPEFKNEMEIETKGIDRGETEMNMDVSMDGDDVSPFVGYCAPIRLVSSSFDRTYKVLEEDRFYEI